MADSAILILAGGRSSRMGCDKAALTIDGKSLLQWQVDRLSGLGFPVYHSGPGGIEDRLPGFPGPLAGIDAAMHQCPSIRHWVVLAVDMPALPPERLPTLLRRTRTTGRPAAYEAAPLPLALTASPELSARLHACLSDPEGPRSLRWLHGDARGDWLSPPEDPAELMNVNTPQDWRFWLDRDAGGRAHEQTHLGSL